jgi:hypothetical protein
MGQTTTGHILTEKPDKEKSYGRSGYRWKHRIKLKLKFGRCWVIHLVQDKRPALDLYGKSNEYSCKSRVSKFFLWATTSFWRISLLFAALHQSYTHELLTIHTTTILDLSSLRTQSVEPASLYVWQVASYNGMCLVATDGNITWFNIPMPETHLNNIQKLSPLDRNSMRLYSNTSQYFIY